MRSDAFDVGMLACHSISCLQQVLFFFGAISVESGLLFEVALLGCKTLIEIALDALPRDLVAHHVAFVLATCCALFRFPLYSSSVLFVNIIHLPLALNYARKLVGARRGGAVDAAFCAEWLLVCGARFGMLSTQCYRTTFAHGEPLPVRWIFYLAFVFLTVLDTQWTRETFATRPLPRGWTLQLGGGALLGAHFESRAMKAAWGAASAVSLLLGLRAFAVRGSYLLQGPSERSKNTARD